MAVEQYTRKGESWYKGCGCGQKPVDRVDLPQDSRPVFIQGNGEYIGPVSGKKYRIYPNLIAIDIRSADAAAWLENHTAREPMPGFKGHLTRLD